MNNKIKNLFMTLTVTAAALSFTACDDWTEPEHIDINYSTIEDAPNYQEYLASLRAYRAKPHKLVYAWVSLSENGPLNQSERVTSLPDSIDVLVLSTPNEIHPQVLADVARVRSEKGMQVIYQLDFDAIRAAHTAVCEDMAKQRSDLELAYSLRDDAANEAVKAELAEKLAELADPSFEDFTLEHLSTGLKYAADKNLDGVMFAFDGKATTHLTGAELKDYRAQQLIFLGAARDWHKRNPSLRYDFLGLPQNIEDKDLLGEFNMIFVRQGLDATNANLFTYYLTLASVDGVPADRLGMMSTYTSADPNDNTTGYFSNGGYALDGFASWLINAEVACVGIKNVQNDYFNPEFVYPHVRSVIQAANPNIK